MAEVKKEKPDYPEVVGQVQQNLPGRMGLFKGASVGPGRQDIDPPMMGYPDMPSGAADIALAKKKKKEEGVPLKAKRPNRMMMQEEM